MLIDPERSYYYNELVKLLGPEPGSRSVRNLTWSRLDQLTPGYYGSRGADLLLQHMGILFLEELRAFTRVNKIAWRIGVSDFLQHVLVLEAAALLIMDDFPDYGEAEAGQIMKETTRLGELAHPWEDR